MPDSKAHVVLDAVHFAAEADLSSLGQLIASKLAILPEELVLRVLLTFLPESVEPSKYTPLLHDLSQNAIVASSGATTIARPSKNIPIDEAKQRIRKLKLLPLQHDGIPISPTDLLEKFLLCRAYRIEDEIGSTQYIQELIEPFIQKYKLLAIWATSTLLPLQRLESTTPEGSNLLGLQELATLKGRTGLDTLLLVTKIDSEKGHDYSAQLRTIIAPWLVSSTIDKNETGIAAGLRPSELWTAAWTPINNWLVDLASIDYDSALKTYQNWRGPRDADLGSYYTELDSLQLDAATEAYHHVGLSLFYMSPSSNERPHLDSLLATVAERTQSNLSESSSTSNYKKYRSKLSDTFLSSISHIHLANGELLDSSNPLTTPSKEAIEFAQLILVSVDLIGALRIELTIEKATILALFDSPSSQWSTCLKAVHNLPSACGRNDKSWIDARDNLLWLRDWNTQIQPGGPRQGLLSQVVLEDLHTAYFESLLTNGQYKAATDLYCQDSSTLPTTKVKDSLINVALASYDNASNGNKTRGGIKKAAEIITTFQSYFPGFQRFESLWALIQATHRLSFYSLSLQHGISLLPVNIRIHPEPLTLLDKVLKQNPHSYTKLDDLLDIGRYLVKAGRITFPTLEGLILPEPEALLQVEQAITAKAISASLAEHDFDTAYSYIISRLSHPSAETPSSEHLWLAAYEAGRYTQHNLSPTSPSTLRRLEQRMELLSQALLLAPTPSLPSVLSTWRSCERDLNAALALESREEDAWQAKGDRGLPGGFSHDVIAPPLRTKTRESTRRAMDEEAPMGLFDVARGAAAALSKSAFPLRGTATAQAARTSGESARSADAYGEDGTQRVRKRDMVSNIVTGGLASGIGWVIGAPPVKHDS